MRVEGLSTSKHYNGLIARVELRLEGGRYRVVLEQDSEEGKVLSLNGDNLVPVDGGKADELLTLMKQHKEANEYAKIVGFGML